MIYFTLPEKSDGSPPSADLIEFLADIEAEEAERLAWREAEIRIAKGTHSQSTRELIAYFDDEDAEISQMQSSPAFAKNEFGQNTLIRPPVKVDNQAWRVLDIASLKNRPVPVRQWIVPQWLPSKVVTLHYADGGVGKTLLALQLMAACASGGTWCGLSVTPCKSVGLFSEDDSDELHLRIDSICRRYGLSLDELTGMFPVDGVGQDNTLVRFERDGQMVLTPRFHRLRQQALDTGARLVVIDTAATTFGGNEIDRAQVTAFVGTALTSLAQDINGAVLLNAHPSVTGMASGDLRSGSTAWNNSCRSRWALTRPTDDAGKPDLRSHDRILTRQKANAASTGDTVQMRWDGGVFVVPNVARAFAAVGRKDEAEAAFLAGIRARNANSLHVSESSKAGNYAPVVLANTAECQDFRKAELVEALKNLLKRGVIVSKTYKRNSRTYEELVIVADTSAGETGRSELGFHPVSPLRNGNHQVTAN